jgi:hypothetical protein
LLQSDACEVGFQHMIDRHYQCCHKTKAWRRGWGRWEWNLYCCMEECEQFTKTSDHFRQFLKINVSCVKKCEEICEVFWIIHVFQLFACLLFLISLHNKQFTVVVIIF